MEKIEHSFAVCKSLRAKAAAPAASDASRSAPFGLPAMGARSSSRGLGRGEGEA